MGLAMNGEIDFADVVTINSDDIALARRTMVVAFERDPTLRIAYIDEVSARIREDTGVRGPQCRKAAERIIHQLFEMGES